MSGTINSSTSSNDSWFLTEYVNRKELLHESRRSPFTGKENHARSCHVVLWDPAVLDLYHRRIEVAWKLRMSMFMNYIAAFAVGQNMNYAVGKLQRQLYAYVEMLSGSIYGRFKESKSLGALFSKRKRLPRRQLRFGRTQLA